MQRVSKAILGAAVFCMAADLAKGAVNLNYSNGTATPALTTVTAGSTFTVDVVLTTTNAEPVSGLSYQVNTSANNTFTLTARNITTSGTPFTSYNTYPDGDSNLVPKTLTTANGNGVDLGAVYPTSSGVTGASGDYEVARLTFSVASNALGSYTLGFVPAFNKTNYDGAPPNYTPTAFNNEGTYTVNVLVPEPASLAVVGLIGLAGLRRRR